MKLTNGEIFSAREPLKKLMEERLPVKCSFKLAKLANKLNVGLKDIEDARNGLIKKYGTKNEKGRLEVKPDSPEYEKFVEEFNDLMDIEVEVVVERISLPESLEIEPSTLIALEKFIEV